MDEISVRLAVMSIALATFIEETLVDRRVSSQIMAELWMIPTEAFGDDIVSIYRKVDEYIDYDLGRCEEPEWVEDDWFDPNW